MGSQAAVICFYGLSGRQRLSRQETGVQNDEPYLDEEISCVCALNLRKRKRRRRKKKSASTIVERLVDDCEGMLEALDSCGKK